MRNDPLRGRAVLGLALLLLAVVPAVAEDAADPFEQARADFMAAEGFEARLAVIETFLADHPDHERVPEVLGVARDLHLQENGDRAAAVALAEQQLARTTDPEIADGIRGVLVSLYADPAYADRLAELVAEQDDPASMSFVEHLDVLEAAAGAHAWDVVDAHVKAAEPKANAATFRADYPDNEYTDEQAAESGRNREGLILTYAGWSRANQGDPDGALAVFREADGKLRKGYLGVPGNELYRYWGQTLLMADQTEKGLDRLALAAIYGNDEEAEAVLREHWSELRPGQDFEAYAWSVRLEHAPTMSDFVATDYEGKPRSFQELRGDEVTLLAFWFPT